ncbi:MAG: sulfate transporter family protein [Rhizobiaceae bacterium]
MIFTAARRALSDLGSAELRPILYKTIGLTLAALIGLWFLLGGLADWLALPFVDDLVDRMPDWAGWLSALATIVVGIGIAIGLAFLLGPATAIVAGFFQDDVAERIEQRSYPADAPGTALPLARSAVLSLKFFGVVLAGNLLGLVLLLVPGVNIIAFFVINGYLLGREFFEFAAMRFRPEADSKALRRRHAGSVFIAGLLVAGVMFVPVVNLLAPFFGAALMVHLHKLITERGAGAAAGPGRNA